MKAMSPPRSIDLERLGLDRGAHLLIERALASLPVGGRLEVTGKDPNLAVHLAGWCRAQGHQLDGTTIVKGAAGDERWAQWRTTRRS